jgi:magnesium chelatase family protein
MASNSFFPPDFLNRYVVLGELALDGSLMAVAGALPAAIAANGREMGLICPKASGAEAAWAGEDIDILAPDNLIQLINHVKGTQVLSAPKPALAPELGASARWKWRRRAGIICSCCGLFLTFILR